MDYLQHHGILGQKWGVRRYQNADGSYTAKGLKEHAKDQIAYIKHAPQDALKTVKKKISSQIDTEKIKKYAKVGAIVAGTALAAYGAYKISSVMKEKRMLEKYKKVAEDSMTAFGNTKRVNREISHLENREYKMFEKRIEKMDLDADELQRGYDNISNKYKEIRNSSNPSKSLVDMAKNTNDKDALAYLRKSKTKAIQSEHRRKRLAETKQIMQSSHNKIKQFRKT